MGLGKRIEAAVSAALAAVMNTYAWERTGHLLPPLSWSLDTSGLLVGYAGADYADDEVAGVLIRWAEALDLTPTSVTPACAGSAVYSGTVQGRAVLVWGVVDRDTWEQPATQPAPDSPLPWELQVAAAVRAVFPTAVAEQVVADEAIGALTYRLRQQCDASGQSPAEVLGALAATDRDFCARAEQPAAFLASKIRDGAW